MRNAFFIVMMLLAFYRQTYAQESVAITTGLSDQMYGAGKHESTTPAVVPTAGLNRRGASVDVSDHKNPAICLSIGLTHSIDGGKTWEPGGSAGGICGQSNGHKDKSGNPLSARSVLADTSVVLPKDALIKSFIEVTGPGQVRTNSAIKMWEVK